MYTDYETVKNIIESEQGRPLSPDENIELKAVYYFARCLEMRAELSWWNRLKMWLRRVGRDKRRSSNPGNRRLQRKNE